ncbi:hypothetical protein K431DRAFT_288182 [Polychaeton citri CBS 116435]|uniref:Uncharacterized protein n=1 Tax=Polychaeton citri CBS 116435 TaxID=1314669 RepID=A0A9P4UKU8_9PEZI|nr:hypothetical protein K431DRAFT_288182 [Polychaeton citri CBS 116435]
MDNKRPEPPLNDLQIPTRSVEPNCMSYEDGDGVKREIYLPQGSFQAASDYFQNQRWDELAKFVPYTGQGYSESDYKSCAPPLSVGAQDTEQEAVQTQG